MRLIRSHCRLNRVYPGLRILPVFSLLLLMACSTSFNQFYDVKELEKTEPEIYLERGTVVTVYYPQLSSSLIDKFNIGEFSTIDFTDLLYQEFILQLIARDVIIMEGDSISLNSISIAITDFNDEGIPEFNMGTSGGVSQPYDRSIFEGRLGEYPPCYELEGIISYRTPNGLKSYRLRKDDKGMSYARSIDLIENLRMFTTSACDLLMMRSRTP